VRLLEELSPSERLDLGDLVLTKGVSIHGRVDDGAGGEAQLAGSRVAIRALDDHKTEKDPEAGPYSNRWRSPTWSQRHEFRYDHLSPGWYRVAVIEGAPGTLRAAWSSVVVDARSDVKALVLSVPEGSLWRGRILAPGAALPEGSKVVCRGVQGDWVRFGQVGPAGGVEIRARSYPFLIGIEMGGGSLAGLRWIGRVEQGTDEVPIPEGGLRFDMPRSGYDAPSFIRIVYLNSDALGQHGGALLTGDAPSLNPGMQIYEITGLVPGSYRLDTFWGRHEQSHSFKVLAGQETRSDWVFR